MTNGNINHNTKLNEMNITDEFLMVSTNSKGSVVAQSLQKLSEGGVVLVTKSKNEVIGYITKRELVDAVAVGFNPAEMLASQLMNTDFMEVMEDDTVGNLIPLISRRYPNAIVVINYNLKCVGFFSKNDYKDALAALGCYDQSRQPESPEDWRTQGVAMSAMGRTDEAIICYEKSISINPNNDDAWMNRGNVYSLLRNPNQALQSYTRALSINPENLGALINKGLAHSDVGEVDNAIKCYEKAEIIKGETGELWYRKGAAYDKVHRFKDAIKCYERAIKLDNRNEDAWFNKGAVLHRMGKKKKAIQCMEMVLRINPNNESAKEAIDICRSQGIV
jgi:tetratricopeptide (TPR) repeat protein